MAQQQRNVPLTCSGHTRPVVHLSFSPHLEQDGSYLLISSCKDGNPMLRDWKGDWLGTFIGHKGAVWSTRLDTTGSRAVSGSADFTAKLWDTFTGEALLTLPHPHIVRSVSFSPRGTHILSGSQDKKVRLFDVEQASTSGGHGAVMRRTPGSPGGAKQDSHDGTVRSVLWTGDSEGVSAGEDGVIRWWDLRTLSPTSSLRLDAPVTSMELSAPHHTLVITSGKTVSFIPASSPGSSAPPPYPIHSFPFTPSSASLHPLLPDRYVVGSLTDPWVRVFDFQTGEEKEVYKGHHGPVHTVEYSPDGEMYATGSEDGTIRLWQTTPGKTYGLWQAVDPSAAQNGSAHNGNANGQQQFRQG
ncbi:serine/threonine kinase receptor associated protein [Calocera viscosa TUFC12733]|uniref:Serine-threonine kinase receptor-associated protein n=1 Tax=Calocera viscosa (strain TUFC12733) TaxID=1330018 RepID=A0A167RTV9_CALVF|nr:serine/threonine kinase receptor associated protein [Calocera viscosa TUFC12733]